jgi:hypothetical protein
MNYRKIWMDHHGPIPVDENGITYDIHHIDGNRNNNDISNLIAVSIKEHYQIHYDRGEYSAAHLISKRLKITFEEKAVLNKKLSEYFKNHPDRLKLNKKISDNQKGKPHPVKKVTCPHCGKIGSGGAMKQWHFDKCEKFTGVKNKMSESFKQKLRKSKSEKHKQNMRKPKSNSHINKMKASHICPYCLKKGSGNAMKQWHFNNCKYRT